ncbi:hypothetical protein ABZ901_22315, partial [Actinacidiphila alni]|uniref:hypothetical protein n=1 Tax=Actinacidiphila alni TaxID=380248 RepID=UPI0033C54023
MRVFNPVAGAAVAVAASVLLAPAAFADNAPGDNGTIKIHDAKTGEALVKNEPHVCTFYLDAFGFDGLQQADWKIFQHAPTGSDLAKSGAITLDTAGHGRTDDMTLPDGHYKLAWNFDAEHGKAKQKVFWVTCDDNGNGGPGGGTGTPSDSPSPSSSASSGGSTEGSTAGSSGGADGGSSSGGTQPGGSATPTSSSTSAAAVADTESPAPSNGSLASTGTSVIGVTAVAALLLAGGAA